MTQNLIALNGEWEVGRVHRAANGRLSFIYDNGWQELSDAYPLSLSMPLTASDCLRAQPRTHGSVNLIWPLSMVSFGPTPTLS